MLVVVYLILAGLLLVMAETTSSMHFNTEILPPDCHYILIAYLAYRLDIPRSLVILIPLSCALDAVSGTVFFGMYALFCYSSYAALRFLSRRLPITETIYRIPLTACTYLLFSWIMYALLVFLPSEIVVAPWSWEVMIFRTLLIMAFTWPLFLIFDLLRKLSFRNPLPLRKLNLRTDNRRRTPPEV